MNEESRKSEILKIKPPDVIMGSEKVYLRYLDSLRKSYVWRWSVFGGGI